MTQVPAFNEKAIELHALGRIFPGGVEALADSTAWPADAL